MRELKGLAFLAQLTFRRLAWSRKSAVAAALLLLATAVAFAWGWRQAPRDQQNRLAATPAAVQRWRPERLLVDGLYRALQVPDAEAAAARDFQPNYALRFADRFAMRIYLSFLLPMVCLLYAAGAWADERDERTLPLLLVRPLTPWKMHLAKAAGVAPLTLAVGLGGFALVCAAAGVAGRLGWTTFAPAVAWTTLGYTALFLAFGAALARPMVFGAAYIGFLEFLVGNLPGTIKRCSVSYYGKCVMYEAGAAIGLQPASQNLFLPVSGDAARIVLAFGSLALLALGAWRFHRREHHDLS